MYCGHGGWYNCLLGVKSSGKFAIIVQTFNSFKPGFPFMGHRQIE